MKTLRKMYSIYNNVNNGEYSRVATSKEAWEYVSTRLTANQQEFAAVKPVYIKVPNVPVSRPNL